MVLGHFKSLVMGATALALTLAIDLAARAQGPSDFLRRVDENGNGMIDPEEMNGRSGFFLRRMAENNPRLDLSRPIPIDKLSEEFSRMREERMRSGGGGPMFGPPGGGGPGGWSPGGGPPGGGWPGGGPGGWPGGGPPGGGWPGGGWPRDGRGGDGRGGDGRGGPFDQSSPYSPRTTKVEPLVPGFDAVSTPKLPPGFGAEAELFTVEVTPQDREEAARSFGRYDDNHDGKIDAEEMRRSRYGNDLPIYDRNHDGVLTLSEMEYRYARRRVENTRDAATASRSEGDRDRDRDRRRDGRSPERRGEDEASASSDDKKDDRKSYRRKPPIERLPVGIPDWFARDDADGDGQIAMAEYSTSWTDTVMADFNQFDLNRDGLVTPSEAVKATSNGAVRGGSIGGNSASAPAAPTAPAAATELSSTPATTSSSAPAAPSASKPAEPIKIEPKYYEYFKKLVVKYDKNSDGVLTPDEWSSMSKSPEAADADGDKRITVEEYTRWSVQR